MANVAPKVDTLSKDVKALTDLVQSLTDLVKSLTESNEKMNKQLTKVLKDARKANKASSGKKSSSGLEKLIDVSPELKAFLKLKPDEKISRVSGTKAITAYIKEHKLQDPTNGRIIHLDPVLSKFLSPAKGQVVTWFNLQTLLKPHFLN